MSKDSDKVVVRLLPPEITEQELLATIDETHRQYAKWWMFLVGKRYKGEAKPSINSRCYFQFESTGKAEDFIRDYHGHQFVDSQGEQFRAVACFAPYQKVPRQKTQKDPRDGTIDDDAYYKEFLASRAESGKVTYEAPPDYKLLLKPADYGDTPLLNYMKTKSKERRARLEKRNKKWMDSIEEYPKKPKWRCTECGTSKHLEEDPDDRGTFYCAYCWEQWETAEVPVPKKKKKKKSKYAEQEEEVEWTEEVPTKKKKKKKDKEAEDWAEWRPKNSAAAEEEGEADEKSRRRRKKKKDDEAAGEEESTGKSRWRVKKTDTQEDSAYWEAEETKHRSSRRGAHKESKESTDWWTDDSWKSDKRSAGESSGGRWRARKGTGDEAAAEEKQRRSRRDKADDESYWVPKKS